MSPELSFASRSATRRADTSGFFLLLIGLTAIGLLIGWLTSACTDQSSTTGNAAPAHTVIVPGDDASAAVAAAQPKIASARVAASLLTSTAFNVGLRDPVQRKAAAQYLQSAASAINSLSAGQPPTTAQFQAAIRLWTDQADPIYVDLARSLGDLWAAYYPTLSASNNAALTLAYLQAVSAGVRDASMWFLDAP